MSDPQLEQQGAEQMTQTPTEGIDLCFLHFISSENTPPQLGQNLSFFLIVCLH
jgi:hypothetical protein